MEPVTTECVEEDTAQGKFVHMNLKFNTLPFRYLFMWPNSRISVMGGEQAANVLSTVQKEKKKREGAEWTDQQDLELRKPVEEKFEKEGHPYFASARLWDDGVIDPKDTRKVGVLSSSLITQFQLQVLGLAFQSTLQTPIPDTKFGVFRM